MEMQKPHVRAAGALCLGGLLSAVAVPSTLAEAADRSIRICNHASSRIIHVYATHVDRTDWGYDLLIGAIWPDECRTIDPGYSGGYCMLDWKLETKDGRYLEKRLNACQAENWHIHD
jgi:hypothetical protein